MFLFNDPKEAFDTLQDGRESMLMVCKLICFFHPQRFAESPQSCVSSQWCEVESGVGGKRYKSVIYIWSNGMTAP